MESSNALIKVPCAPLSGIFEMVGLHHANFFSLVVQGQKAPVLNTIDWEKFSFDVMVRTIALSSSNQ